MILSIWEGPGRVRTKLVEWELMQQRDAQAEADLRRARELDALEFGRRSDARGRAATPRERMTSGDASPR